MRIQTDIDMVGSRGEVANVLGCNIVVSEFELQLRYYIHFQTNTLGKHINSLISACWAIG